MYGYISNLVLANIIAVLHLLIHTKIILNYFLSQCRLLYYVFYFILNKITNCVYFLSGLSYQIDHSSHTVKTLINAAVMKKRVNAFLSLAGSHYCFTCVMSNQGYRSLPLTLIMSFKHVSMLSTRQVFRIPQ